MKIVEEKYCNLIKMLEAVKSENEIVEKCLSVRLAELSFSYFSADEHKTSKAHIFDIYKTRSIVLPHDKGKEPFVIGYENLLPALEKSDVAFVNVSALTTEKGTFIIFSDYEYQKYIGILKSKNTLTEVRETMAGSPYYQETTFFNGNLINKELDTLNSFSNQQK